MPGTLRQEESYSELLLDLMSHVFIRISIITFLAKISTFPEIMMQIMLVLGGFWKLRCGDSLSKTYSTSQENN